MNGKGIPKTDVLEGALSPSTSNNNRKEYNDVAHVVRIGKEEKRMEQNELIERLIKHNRWGIGLEISTQTIYDVDRHDDKKEFNRRKQQLYQLKVRKGLPFKRSADTEYIRKKQIYNTHISRSLLTHAIDYYRWSDGYITKRGHDRGNMIFDGKPILMGLIVNIQTQKRYYKIWDDNKETSFRTAQLCRLAIDNGENIEYLVSDRLYKKTIKALEKLGITPVVYDKVKEKIVIENGKKKKYKGICYNYEAERQFTNISKAFDAIRNDVRDLDLRWSEAKELFLAILQIHYEHDDTLLLKWDKYIEERKAQLLTIPQIVSA